MKPIELKFVLKLLGHEGYRAPISKLNPSDKTSASDRDKICKDLASRGIVAYSHEVKQFKIEPAGKALLKQDIANLPLTAQQLTVLKACEDKMIKPGDLKLVPSEERQPVIQDLEVKGFIKIDKAQIKEVWLTQEGQKYLKEDYKCSGTATISLNLLQSYLLFLRRSTQLTPENLQDTSIAPLMVDKPDDEEILQIIQSLDYEYGTNNYLPIFYIRQKLQPSMSREEVDQALYRLQRQKKIQLSTLQEGFRYTSEQVSAGILQPLGGPLFFIRITD